MIIIIIIIIIITMCPAVGLIGNKTYSYQVCLSLNCRRELRCDRESPARIESWTESGNNNNNTDNDNNNNNNNNNNNLKNLKKKNTICVYLAHCLNLPISQIRLA